MTEALRTPDATEISTFSDGTQPHRFLQILTKAGLGSLVTHDTFATEVLEVNGNGGGKLETRRQRIGVIANKVRTSLRGSGFGIDVVDNEGYILNPYEWPNYTWPNGKPFQSVYSGRTPKKKK